MLFYLFACVNPPTPEVQLVGPLAPELTEREQEVYLELRENFPEFVYEESLQRFHFPHLAEPEACALIGKLGAKRCAVRRTVPHEGVKDFGLHCVCM